MYDADTLEAINFEQLVTATDRLLFRRGCMPKHRPSVPSLVPPAPLARGSHPHIEYTAGRSAASPRSQMFAVTVVIPTLIGVAAGLAAML